MSHDHDDHDHDDHDYDDHDHDDHDYDDDDLDAAALPPSHLPPDWPTTVDEAVDRLLAFLSPESLQTIREADSVLRFHFGLGTGIRNQFGLWDNNDALKASCLRWKGDDDRSYPELLDAEAASGIILDALHQRLRQEH